MATGRVVLVTGASNGIGKALTEALLRQGNKVSMCDVAIDAGKVMEKLFAHKYGSDNIKFFSCDVSNSEKFEDCFVKTKMNLGEIDIVVNNAGVCDETQNGWKKNLDVNLTGAIRGSKLAVKYMGRSGGGKGGLVVNFGSILALKNSCRPYPVYAASKLAIHYFTSSMGTETHFGLEGIKYITVAPGPTAETNFLEHMTTNKYSVSTLENLEQFLKDNPPQRVESVASGVMTLLEDPPNGSIWLITKDLPPEQIMPTANLNVFKATED